jgi:hypothetical protein
MPRHTHIPDLGFDIHTSFTPANISVEHMPLLFRDVPESVKEYARKLRDNGWKFYAVSQRRGRCYYHAKLITIPVWCISSKRGVGYKIWYISHELAHAMDECKHDHGPQFMEWLKKICPPEHIKWELGYKPRNATKAGIGVVSIDKLLEL